MGGSGTRFQHQSLLLRLPYPQIGLNGLWEGLHGGMHWCLQGPQEFAVRERWCATTLRACSFHTVFNFY